MLTVYFAREMFVASDGLNHQASYGFILNKNTFERISSMNVPYASHSFNQYILPIEDGFLFVDQGDYYPRGFYFNKITNTQKKSITAFRFKQNEFYNNTFAQLGGIAQTNDGYLFVGTYEKNNSTESYHNDSRNVFLINIDKDFNHCGNPIWITNYSDKNSQNAVSPKITKLNGNRYLIMWECFGYPCNNTYYTIIDKDGETIKEITELPNVRLNNNDVLRYNFLTGNVHWAVNEGSRTIQIYSFNPYNFKLIIE
jgi:hypothetical protein